MKTSIASALCLATAAFCQNAHSVASSTFVDGRTYESQWFRQAGDLYSGTAQLRSEAGTCTGTLISPTALLTAAHCLNSAKTAFFIDDATNRYTGITIKSFAANPGYTGSAGQDVDLAVAILDRPAPAGARISSFYKSPVNRAYVGSVLVGGYGQTRDPVTGGLASPAYRQMLGTIDGTLYNVGMPALHVGSNYLHQSTGADASTRSAWTDLDRWFPARQNSLGPAGFDHDTQKSMYGFQQYMAKDKRAFLPGSGVIPYAPAIEAVTLPGDSGGAVFFNPRALVTSVLWHTDYQKMAALGGVPDAETLGPLDDLYADDTNYIVGITSQGWTNVSCPGGAAYRDCLFNNVIGFNGGGKYSLAQGQLGWIDAVLAGAGAGSVRAGGSGLGATTGELASFEPLGETLGLLPFDAAAPMPVPEPQTWALMAAGLLGVAVLRRRRDVQAG